MVIVFFIGIVHLFLFIGFGIEFMMLCTGLMGICCISGMISKLGSMVMALLLILFKGLSIILSIFRAVLRLRVNWLRLTNLVSKISC